jgi:pyruvate formate-lyase activating enzyme-like uncharacterized protein
MELRGFNLSSGITAGAKGSAELAMSMRDRINAAELGLPDPLDKVIRKPFGYSLKFCTAVYKDAGQLRRRFLRRGEATIAPHETLTEDGTLMFGAISSSDEDQEVWISEIMEETNLPRRFLYWDKDNQRIELPLVVAESIAPDVEAPVSLVEVLPTFERIEMSLIWLNEYPK